jgi:hypothetical protein
MIFPLHFFFLFEQFTGLSLGLGAKRHGHSLGDVILEYDRRARLREVDLAHSTSNPGHIYTR